MLIIVVFVWDLVINKIGFLIYEVYVLVGEIDDEDEKLEIRKGYWEINVIKK